MKMKLTTDDKKKIIDALREAFPSCFDMANPRPLAVGTYADIRKLTPEQFKSDPLKAALNLYCRRYPYLTACSTAGAKRINVFGEVTGEVTAKEAEHARERLAANEQWFREAQEKFKAAREEHAKHREERRAKRKAKKAKKKAKEAKEAKQCAGIVEEKGGNGGPTTVKASYNVSGANAAKPRLSIFRKQVAA
jgi:sRNA-binding protein